MSAGDAGSEELLLAARAQAEELRELAPLLRVAAAGERKRGKEEAEREKTAKQEQA